MTGPQHEHCPLVAHSTSTRGWPGPPRATASNRSGQRSREAGVTARNRSASSKAGLGAVRGTWRGAGLSPQITPRSARRRIVCADRTVAARWIGRRCRHPPTARLHHMPEIETAAMRAGSLKLRRSAATTGDAVGLASATDRAGPHCRGPLPFLLFDMTHRAKRCATPGSNRSRRRKQRGAWGGALMWVRWIHSNFVERVKGNIVHDIPSVRTWTWLRE